MRLMVVKGAMHRADGHTAMLKLETASADLGLELAIAADEADRLGRVLADAVAAPLARVVLDAGMAGISAALVFRRVAPTSSCHAGRRRGSGAAYPRPHLRHGRRPRPGSPAGATQRRSDARARDAGALARRAPPDGLRRIVRGRRGTALPPEGPAVEGWGKERGPALLGDRCHRLALAIAIALHHLQGRARDVPRQDPARRGHERPRHRRGPGPWGG
jgi:hypothetical protein